MPVRTADEIERGKTEWREKVSADNSTIPLTLVTTIILGFRYGSYQLGFPPRPSISAISSAYRGCILPSGLD